MKNELMAKLPSRSVGLVLERFLLKKHVFLVWELSQESFWKLSAESAIKAASSAVS